MAERVLRVVNDRAQEHTVRTALISVLKDPALNAPGSAARKAASYVMAGRRLSASAHIAEETHNPLSAEQRIKAASAFRGAKGLLEEVLRDKSGMRHGDVLKAAIAALDERQSEEIARFARDTKLLSAAGEVA